MALLPGVDRASRVVNCAVAIYGQVVGTNVSHINSTRTLVVTVELSPKYTFYAFHILGTTAGWGFKGVFKALALTAWFTPAQHTLESRPALADKSKEPTRLWFYLCCILVYFTCIIYDVGESQRDEGCIQLNARGI